MQKPPFPYPTSEFTPLSSPFGRLFEQAREILASVPPLPADDDLGDAFEIPEDRLIDPDELLRVAREPLDWILTLAHRLAGGDPIDVAAIDRLRSAFHGRLAGRAIGVRMSDVLTVFGLLATALDPDVVVQAVADSVTDGIAAVLSGHGGRARAVHLANVADAAPARPRAPAVTRRRRRNPGPHAP